MFYRGANVSGTAVVVASGIESVLIWLSGVVVAIPFLVAWMPHLKWLWIGGGAGLLIAALNPLSLRWLLLRSIRGWRAADTPLLYIYAWLFLYAAAWVVGGILLFAIARLYQPLELAALPTFIGSWAISGCVSLLALVLPSGFGLMEISLTFLLARVMPPGLAALTAISARILITALDVLAGGAGWLLGRQKKPS